MQPFDSAEGRAKRETFRLALVERDLTSRRKVRYRVKLEALSTPPSRPIPSPSRRYPPRKDLVPSPRFQSPSRYLVIVASRGQTRGNAVSLSPWPSPLPSSALRTVVTVPDLKSFFFGDARSPQQRRNPMSAVISAPRCRVHYERKTLPYGERERGMGGGGGGGRGGEREDRSARANTILAVLLYRRAAGLLLLERDRDREREPRERD